MLATVWPRKLSVSTTSSVSRIVARPMVSSQATKPVGRGGTASRGASRVSRTVATSRGLRLGRAGDGHALGRAEPGDQPGARGVERGDAGEVDGDGTVGRDRGEARAQRVDGVDHDAARPG